MRICLFAKGSATHVGSYTEETVVDLTGLARVLGEAVPHEPLDLLGPGRETIRRREMLAERMGKLTPEQQATLVHKADAVTLRAPVPSPNKFLLLAGNYAEHIREGGGVPPERLETFPYVFMKPPTTTISHPGEPVRIPSISPEHIDWEIELAIVMGRTCKSVTANDALSYVAGYTVVTDVSDRQFRPNPGRKERPKDSFFDWLHGKWHDGFAPMGPCILPAEEVGNVQNLKMTLRVNDHVEQDGTTSQMIFPVADTIAFISQFVTLERGDIISTGTPSGVGAGKGKFLRPGDRIDATIAKIGTLTSPLVG